MKLLRVETLKRKLFKMTLLKKFQSRKITIKVILNRMLSNNKKRLKSHFIKKKNLKINMIECNNF